MRNLTELLPKRAELIAKIDELTKVKSPTREQVRSLNESKEELKKLEVEITQAQKESL
jgi:hypothetical protein